jgi:hypothetical protein
MFRTIVNTINIIVIIMDILEEIKKNGSISFFNIIDTYCLSK